MGTPEGEEPQKGTEEVFEEQWLRIFYINGKHQNADLRCSQNIKKD